MDVEAIRELIKDEINRHIPIGAIFAFPSEDIPENYLPCEGQELSSVQYPELFNIIGTTYGGSSNSFNLPDLQGIFIRGLDREGNIDCDSINPRKIGSIQEDCFQGHGHNSIGKDTKTSKDGVHSHDMYKEVHGGGFGTNFYSVNHDGFAYSDNCKIGKVKIQSAGNHCHLFIPEVDVLEPKNNTFGRVRFNSETRPINMSLIYCIKIK